MEKRKQEIKDNSPKHAGKKMVKKEKIRSRHKGGRFERKGVAEAPH